MFRGTPTGHICSIVGEREKCCSQMRQFDNASKEMKADRNAGKITAKQQKAKGKYKGSSIDSSLASKKAYSRLFRRPPLQRQGEARWTVALVQIQHTLGSSFYRALKTSSSLQSLPTHVDFELHWPGVSMTKIMLRLLCSGYPEIAVGKKQSWVLVGEWG